MIGMALFAVLMCVNFASCSSDDEDESETSSIVGVWKYTSNYDGSGTLTFKNNGGLIWEWDDEEETSSDYTYTLKGSELKIVWAGDDYTLGTFTMFGNNATYEYKWYDADGNSDGLENIMQLTKK